MDIAEHPGKKIRFLLHTHSLTLQKLSDELGIPWESLREIVDEEAVPTPHMLHRICGFFRLKEDYFGDAIKPQPKSGATDTRKVTSARTGRVSTRRQREDLADLFVRLQTLLDCLVAKRVIGLQEYQRRLQALRIKVAERQGTR